MILTESGGIVNRVICIDLKCNMATVEVLHLSGKLSERIYFLNQLKADGGMQELIESAERVLHKKG